MNKWTLTLTHGLFWKYFCRFPCGFAHARTWWWWTVEVIPCNHKCATRYKITNMQLTVNLLNHRSKYVGRGHGMYCNHIIFLLQVNYSKMGSCSICSQDFHTCISCRLILNYCWTSAALTMHRRVTQIFGVWSVGQWACGMSAWSVKEGWPSKHCSDFSCFFLCLRGTVQHWWVSWSWSHEFSILVVELYTFHIFY